MTIDELLKETFFLELTEIKKKLLKKSFATSMTTTTWKKEVFIEVKGARGYIAGGSAQKLNK